MAIYYTQGKTRTHFALVHSDGTPLARTLIEELVAADRSCGGELHKLSCLNPAPATGNDTDSQVAEALAAYRQYLSTECGFIQLDGLPADNDVGSRRLRLENLFVPLHLDLSVRDGQKKRERETVGTVLAESPRLALLAAPGGGKSTLIKRLAVAYADPVRHGQIADDLPQRNWLPLFFRCRELRGLARGSFSELIEALSKREPVRQYSNTFRSYVDRALLDGRILLLVDGLDEVSEPGDRAAFVCTLRAVLQAYPNIGMVVTSREAGFRHVAAHLAPICSHATLSPFDEDDIRRLSVAWHREVVGDTQKVRADAEQLASAISTNDRIRRLAINPLLLTTLLLVKRWVGSLPPRRAVLYGKAVEVLLSTWNTEGHAPIPEEEALPQLCFLAFAMMVTGIQKISRPKLAALLQAARDALPTELGYVQGTVDQFIHRVEDRSSLLMMTGHDIENGQLVEFFEFRHLTFQEFLTARAVVEGWHPGRRESDTLASVLEAHFDEEKWSEVIPLAAVLGGKATETLIRMLTVRVSQIKRNESSEDRPSINALFNCLTDEAAARPETIRAALSELAHHWIGFHRLPSASMLPLGRYGADMHEEAAKAFLGPPPDLKGPKQALAEVVWWRTIEAQDPAGLAKAAERFLALLMRQELLSRCEGALGIMRLCFIVRPGESKASRKACEKTMRDAGSLLLSMLFSESLPEQCSAAWALAWLGTCHAWTPPAKPDTLGRLFMLWRNAGDPEISRLAAWALASQRVLEREPKKYCLSPSSEEIDKAVRAYDKLEGILEKLATLIVAWYGRALSDAELAKRAQALFEGEGGTNPVVRQPLSELCSAWA